MRRTGAVLSIGLVLLDAFGVEASLARADDSDRFDGYEIRVIRPRFMNKSNRFELAGEGTFIMNQSFIYTYMATGLLDYHFSETWALELDGSYGVSVDKQDKRILQSDFSINTQILRTSYIAAGGFLWTPIYGKTQLPSGQVVYFDSFFTLQGGITGIQYLYDQCVASSTVSVSSGNQTAVPAKPAPVTKSYPTIAGGFGQKYFLSQDFGIRWEVRYYEFQYAKADGSCSPTVNQGTDFHPNITLQVGASTFF